MVPFVSVLVPVYKVPEKYLRTCIESLVNQTLKNIEIILIDDGSPDECGAICDEYAKRDERVRVIHKDNGGLAAARNTAFDAAIGECITFVDGDDFLDSNACEIGYRTLKEQNVELVFWNQITEYNNSSKEIKTFGENDIFFSNDECKKLQARVLDFNGKIAQAFSKLIRRDYLLKHNIRHNDKLKQGAEGFIFNIALFENLQSAYYIAKPLYHYVYNENSISHSHNEENYYFIIRCFEYIEKYIKNSSNKVLLEKNLYNRMLYVIVTTGITGYFNPMNKTSYREKVAGYKKFLAEPLIQRSLKNANFEGLSNQRKLIIKCAELNQFWIIAILAKVRRIQLAKR